MYVCAFLEVPGIFMTGIGGRWEAGFVSNMIWGNFGVAGARMRKKLWTYLESLSLLKELLTALGLTGIAELTVDVTRNPETCQHRRWLIRRGMTSGGDRSRWIVSLARIWVCVQFTKLRGRRKWWAKVRHCCKTEEETQEITLWSDKIQGMLWKRKEVGWKSILMPTEASPAFRNTEA